MQLRAGNCPVLFAGLNGDRAAFTASNNPNATIFVPVTRQGNLDLRARTHAPGRRLSYFGQLRVGAFSTSWSTKVVTLS